jgi:transposase
MRTISRLKRYMSMDAKDLLIEQLKAQLLRQAEEFQAQLSATTSQFSEQLQAKDSLIASLQQQIKRLMITVRGSRQERINPDQLLLFTEAEIRQLADELEQAKQTAEGTSDQEPNGEVLDDDSQAGAADSTGDKLTGTDKPAQHNHRGRRRLPVSMPREIRRHELSEEDRKCPCCGDLRKEFGVEVSEQLEYVPAHWKAVEHHRVKYCCTACQENVAVAPKPPQPIEKGLPGPGLCAYSVLSKFGDHLPLYREEDIHSRAGHMIRRSTICNWLYELGLLVEPLVMRMKHLILQSTVIHTDDTKIKMLQPGICQEAKFWPYHGDWLHNYVVFDFTLDRKRFGPQRFLENYEGYLQADAYSGYDCVYAPGKVKEVACWVHTRRYWYDVREHDSVRANTALGYIARLFQIESQLQSAYPALSAHGARDFAAVAQARQKYSRPILEQFKAWLDKEMMTGRILPKSEIKKAFTYTLNQWNALCRYTEEGYLSMDNNLAERMAKYAAIGRKNYLFVGSERAGRNAANFYSLVTSAKTNTVEPMAWLTDVFTQLPYHRGSIAFKQASAGEDVTSTELDYLLPDRWLEKNPDSVWKIDEIRRKERQSKEKTRQRKLKRRK